MNDYKTIETLKAGDITFELESQVVSPPVAYDDTSPHVRLRVTIRKDGLEARIISERVLYSTLKNWRIDPRDLAKENATTMATILSFIADRGRIVRKHALFVGIAKELDIAIGDYLPTWREPTLIWYELRDQSDLGFVQCEALID